MEFQLNSSKSSKRANLKLAVFDLDGTLTTIRSPFHYVSSALGYRKKADFLANQYNNKKISYEDWGKGIVSTWRGETIENISNIVKEIPYRSGAKEFIKGLRDNNVFVSILSVAFYQHVGIRAKQLNVDHFVCNELVLINNRVSGNYKYLVNHSNKKDFVKELQKKLKINAENTLVAGDTTGDIAMFDAAKVSIAISPESKQVRESATMTLPNDDWNKAIKKLKRYFNNF